MTKTKNAIMIVDNSPDYKKIYQDLISLKYPKKKQLCSHLLVKNSFSTLDIINIEKILFNVGFENNFSFNQKHRSYDKSAIFQILEYQKKKNLNNSEVARHFNISRNTLTKWKKKYLV